MTDDHDAAVADRLSAIDARLRAHLAERVGPAVVAALDDAGLTGAQAAIDVKVTVLVDPATMPITITISKEPLA